MNFFDDLVKEVNECLDGRAQKSYPLGKPWQDAGRNEVILKRDTEYELDGIGFNLVSSLPVGESRVVVIGPELNQIKDEARYCRISLIQIDDVDDEQTAYNLIRKVEYAKYHYFPKGFMVRTASTSHKEMVRVSKSALKEGLNFEGVGNLLVNKYLENKAVRAVKLIYITDQSVNFDRLEKISSRNYAITETLNHIMTNVNFDCSTCNLKPVCDEVEGMKELHFKNAKMH